MKWAPELAEAVGTFMLVLVGCGAIASAGSNLVAVTLAFGLVVMAMVHTLGHVSGAHINPAVTFAFAVTGHFPWRRVPAYIGAQLVGATAAAGLLRWFHGRSVGMTELAPQISWMQGFAIEVVATALLMLVISAVATDGRAIGASAGAAIGAAVAISVVWAGPLTNASMNPARSIGPAVIAGELSLIVLYIIGPILGAAIGAALYEALRRGSKPLGRRNT